MKHATTCFLLITLLLPLAAVAQSPPSGAPQLPLQVDFGDTLTFRLQLNEIAGIYDELAGRINPTKNVAIARNLSAKAEQVSDRELAFLMAQGVDLEPLVVALRDLRDIVDQNEHSSAAAGPIVKTAGLPDASYSVVCGSERGNTDAEFAAKVALQVAKGVWSIADRGCNETIVILGEGGNTSLICIIADEILFAAEAILEDFFFCDDSVNAAEIEGSYERLGHMHSDLDALQADATLDMKLMIEQNLMIISPNQIIVSYAVPEASGGLLETVVTVIEGVIQDAMSAGMAVNFAENFLAQANNLRDQGSYKRAFLMYRRAYQEVARLP